MRTEPKLSADPPYRWLGRVTLTPEEPEQVINALPAGCNMRLQLRQTWDKTAAKAHRLNQIDREGAR